MSDSGEGGQWEKVELIREVRRDIRTVNRMRLTRGYQTVTAPPEGTVNLDINSLYTVNETEPDISPSMYIGIAVSYQSASMKDDSTSQNPHRAATTENVGISYNLQIPARCYSTSTPVMAQCQTSRLRLKSETLVNDKSAGALSSNDLESRPKLSPLRRDSFVYSMGISNIDINSPIPVVSPLFETRRGFKQQSIESLDFTPETVDSSHAASFCTAYMDTPSIEKHAVMFTTANSDMPEDLESIVGSENLEGELDDEFYDALTTHGVDTDLELESGFDDVLDHEQGVSENEAVVKNCNFIKKLCRKNDLSNSKSFGRHRKCTESNTDKCRLEHEAERTGNENNLDNGSDEFNLNESSVNDRNDMEKKVLDMRKYLINRNNVGKDILSKKKLILHRHFSDVFSVKHDSKHDSQITTPKTPKKRRHPMESLYERRREFRAKATKSLMNMFVCGCTCTIRKGTHSRKKESLKNKNKIFRMAAAFS